MEIIFIIRNPKNKSIFRINGSKIIFRKVYLFMLKALSKHGNIHLQGNEVSYLKEKVYLIC